MKRYSLLTVLGLWLTLPAQTFADESFSLQLTGGAALSPITTALYPQIHVDVGVPFLKLFKVGLYGSMSPQNPSNWFSGSTLYSLGTQASAWLPFTGLYAGVRFGGSVLTDPVAGPLRLLDSATTFLMVNPFLGWEISWIPFVKPGVQVGYYLPIQRSEFNSLSSVQFMLSVRLSL
jgi:hypothetical protein